MASKQYLSNEDIERRLESANKRKVPMFIKTKDSPPTYRQVCRVRVTADGFCGAVPNATPWDSDVTGTELVVAHEQIRFDLSPLIDEDYTPFGIVQQCKKYVESLPPAITGRGGTVQTQHVATVILHDFALDSADAWVTLLEYNTRCRPCWSVKELRRFMEVAMITPPKDRPRGVLRNKFVVDTFDNEK